VSLSNTDASRSQSFAPMIKARTLTAFPYRMLTPRPGSPKAGDMIARNPGNHEDQWLVAAQYFADNFEAA
jgi:hypothetical protein